MPVNVYTHGRRDQARVALTFDDGPNPPRTEEILKSLAAGNARATFFVIGKWVERWPEAVDQILEAGHVIGNHSYSHDQDNGDFDRAEEVIRSRTRRPTAFLRAPYFCSRLYQGSQVAALSSVRLVHADVVPGDYSLSDPGQVVSRVLQNDNLRAGSIIDLHDGSEKDDERLARPLVMISALPRLIDELKSRGYNLVGLDEMELVEPIAWPA